MSASAPADAALSPGKLADLLAGLTVASGPVLLAVSGGPDSTALMHAFARLRPGGAEVATVDHGLRPGSRDEAEAVAAEAARLGLPHRILVWDRDRPSRVSQAAARRARYGLLADHARAIGAAAFATAHTLDDQAETLLMRLAAGSGPSGLKGMAATSRRHGLAHHRPFLTIAKARLVATCRAERWSFVEDPSNHDSRFARSRWRALMPGLVAEGLDATRLGRLAARMRRAEDALDRAAAAAFARIVREGEGSRRLDLAALAREPDEIVIRVLALSLALPEAPGAAPLRLERVEACAAALLGALALGTTLRRTLAGRLLSLDRAGLLTVAPEPERARGRRAALTLSVAPPPHSLGREDAHA